MCVVGDVIYDSNFSGKEREHCIITCNKKWVWGLTRLGPMRVNMQDTEIPTEQLYLGGAEVSTKSFSQCPIWWLTVQRGTHTSEGASSLVEFSCSLSSKLPHQSIFLGFPGGAVVKNLPANAGDTGWSPGPGRSHMLRSKTRPMCHNYWACALEPASHKYWALMPQLLKPARLEPTFHNKKSHRNEKPAHRNKE